MGGQSGRGRDTPGVTPGCRDGVLGKWWSLGAAGRTLLLIAFVALASEAQTREYRMLSLTERKVPYRPRKPIVGAQ